MSVSFTVSDSTCFQRTKEHKTRTNVAYAVCLLLSCPGSSVPEVFNSGVYSPLTCRSPTGTKPSVKTEKESASGGINLQILRPGAGLAICCVSQDSAWLPRALSKSLVKVKAVIYYHSVFRGRVETKFGVSSSYGEKYIRLQMFSRQIRDLYPMGLPTIIRLNFTKFKNYGKNNYMTILIIKLKSTNSISSLHKMHNLDKIFYTLCLLHQMPRQMCD